MTEEQLQALAADHARDEAREMRMIGVEVDRETELALRERWVIRLKNAEG